MFAFSTAQAMVLDFDDFNIGQIIDDEYAGVGVTVSGSGNTNGLPAVIFDTGNPTGGDTDLAALFSRTVGDSVELLDPGYVLILQENGVCGQAFCDNEPDDDANGGSFTFTWDSPMILNSIDVFDIEANEAGAPITITLATTNGILPMFSVPETGGDNTWGRVDFGGIANVISMTVNLNGSGAIDNLNFEIPLPGVAWLFFPGLAVLGARMRRRQPK